MTDMGTILNTMSTLEKRALIRSNTDELTVSQSDRGTLSSHPNLVDYSFRPARFTDLGRSVQAHLLSVDTPSHHRSE